MFVGAVVAFDYYPVNRGLWPLVYAEFEVNGVVFDGYFHRINPEKQVTVVEVKRRDIASVLAER